jgi:ferritin-like metal-binding protein YciE
MTYTQPPEEDEMARGNDREIVVDWLNSAYAMEKGLIPILENHAKDADRHPDVRARIEQHVEETRRHADLVEGCLEQLGEQPSKVKGAMSGIAGRVQAMATGPFKDEEVKNALSDYATEHFEIAAYRALSEAARAIGEEGIANTCEQICREEQDMANFLEQNLPNTVRDALGRER